MFVAQVWVSRKKESFEFFAVSRLCKLGCKAGFSGSCFPEAVQAQLSPNFWQLFAGGCVCAALNNFLSAVSGGCAGAALTNFLAAVSGGCAGAALANFVAAVAVAGGCAGAALANFLATVSRIQRLHRQNSRQFPF